MKRFTVIPGGPFRRETHVLEPTNLLAKPLGSSHVAVQADPANARGNPGPHGETLDGVFAAGDRLRELMGPSAQVRSIRHQVMQVAGSPLTALIQGETGTGKELVARAIHHLSGRRRGPFVALDCGAIPDTLIESELFGYERGAFTGADQRKAGFFQLAHSGSLFLDEIVNLPLATQATLLRALQERVVQPLGGRCPVPIDVRIIATSNVSLEREARAGRFRQDLYYRLNEFTITLPPLRERLDDILYLANRFLAEASREFGRPTSGISEEAAELLLRYAWPGNVRQLRSVIRQAALADNGIVREHLLPLLTDMCPTPAVGDTRSLPAGCSLKAISVAAVAEAERRAICQALHTTKGNKSAVARLLGIDYKTLYFKLKRYGISGQEVQDPLHDCGGDAMVPTPLPGEP
jgi:two-component system nitrogen regulation response regulator GlnG